MPELSPAKIGNNRENEVYLTKYLNVKSKMKIFFLENIEIYLKASLILTTRAFKAWNFSNRFYHFPHKSNNFSDFFSSRKLISPMSKKLGIMKKPRRIKIRKLRVKRMFRKLRFDPMIRSLMKMMKVKMYPRYTRVSARLRPSWGLHGSMLSVSQ